ncbi:MAG TPA: PHB depolymerase family esterase [Kofleriaceae bacterium]|nr:PHB depolymerase family esterase [Kofleriaceae bacterium]
MRRLAVVVALAACHSPSSAGDGIDAPGGDDDAMIDAPATMIDAGPCGMRGGMRGKTNRMITVGGANRTYIVYLPDGDPKTPMPFVAVFHGYTMSGQNMVDTTGYTALADAEHIALVFPDGQGGPGSLLAPWNVGDNVCPSLTGPPPDASGDDFAFLDAMKGDVESDQCLDQQHVFVTGFSMGGYFSHHTGCMRPDVRAVAPHSGGTHVLDDCPSVHKPIIMFHGKSDPVIPDGCDDPNGTTPAGFTASATMWAAHNGCSTTVKTTPVEMGSCSYYDGCPADGQVAVCTFDNMGHCWAGGAAGLYGCPGYEAATQLEWSFFKQYAW